RLDHRHAELPLKRHGIDVEAVAAGEVDHVERHHRRRAECDQLQSEAKVIVEIAGVEDDQKRVGQPLALLLAQEDVAGHLLIRAGGIETVGAGEVDQLDRPAVGKIEAARLPLDGDARIITDLLSRPGQHVEQGALAGIGIADHRDQRIGAHWPPASTEMAWAWSLRIATVIRPIRIASGSRPKGAPCRASIRTPSSKPRLRSRRASGSDRRDQSIPVTVAGVRNGSWSRLIIASS